MTIAPAHYLLFESIRINCIFAIMKQINIGETFRQDYRITCNDMDSEYRMTPESILNLSQDTIAAFLTTRHLAAFDLQKEGFTWVLSEYTIDLCGALPLWRERLEVVVSPSEISSFKLHFDYRILNKDGDTVITGTSIWSIINVQTGRPEQIAEHCRVCGETAVRHPRIVVKAVSHSDIEFKYITNISDIDFNGHVHNVSYLKIALSVIPFEMSRTKIIKSLTIKFIRQSFIDQVLICSIEKDAEVQSARSSISNEQGQEVCRMSVTMQDVESRDFGVLVDRNRQ